MVLIWNGARVDLPTITQFQSQPVMTALKSSPLNDKPKTYEVPNGWSGSFSVQRDSANLDDLVTDNESAFWSAATITNGTIYFYITETDGSTSTWEYTDASIAMTSAGSWSNDNIVSQGVTFTASQRVKIS
ncbi:hypothetical protein [Acetobacter aceti]|nr:hypothetical protein [Acetobacter aceti]